MEIPLEENKPEIIPEKNVLLKEINTKTANEEKKETNYFEKINSPQLIQDILHLSSHTSQNDYQHQNNMIRSLYSFNDSILPILDDDIFDNDINFNPNIHFLYKRNKLKLMNFSQINRKNDYLLKSLGQYNELKQKILDYKSNVIKDNVEGDNNENIKGDNDENKKKELNLKLFILNHPLINLFKEEIDTKKIEKEIKEEYLNHMKDNSEYKPSPNNPHMINVVEQEILQNEENDENDNEDSIDVSSVQSHEDSEEQEIELMEPNIVEPHDINEGYNVLQQNENNEVNNLDYQINNIQEEQNLVNNEQQIDHGNEEPHILVEPINENNNEINNDIPDIPVPPLLDILNPQPMQPLLPDNPDQQLHPNLPDQPLQPILEIPHMEPIEHIEPIDLVENLFNHAALQPIPHMVQEPIIENIVNEPIPHNELLEPMIIENINVAPVPPIPEHSLNNIEENLENQDGNQQDENNNNENDKKENEEEEKKEQ